MPPGGGLSGHVLASGQAYLNNDARNDPRLFFKEAFSACRAAAGAPLVAQGQITGLLWVGSRRLLAEHDLRLLTAIADIAANAIQRESLREAVTAQAVQMQTILDTVPDGVLLLDEGGRVLLANPAAAYNLSFLVQEGAETPLTHLAGRPLAELLAPPPQGHWHELEARGRFFQITARPLAPGSQPAPADGMDDASDRHWVLVISDETEAHERRRYQQAQERLATVGQLAAGIAHDFNNIMGVIVLYAQLLHNAPGLADRQYAQLKTIRTQADRAANLVQQILDFSRRSFIQQSPLDLLPLVKDLLKLLERTLPEHIRLELGYDRRQYTVNADATQVQQVLMNLAFNARDAMPDGGTLRFTLTGLTLDSGQTPPLPDLGPGDWVQVEVQDTGTGIRPKDLPHIFEPFFTTKAPGKGAGLGLSQVYGIVKQHGGAIDVRSRPDQGSVFTVYLPRLADPIADPEPTPREAAAPGRGETILLVEDNQALQEATAEMLEAWGYGVLRAQNGVEALAVLAEEKVDLVLSDLIMPEMGGRELSRRLRQAYPQVKLLVITGHAPQGEYAGLLQEGVTWLQKPFSVDELAAKVQALLADKTGAGARET
jgi:two-component system, cell cycle sensor histidine kinase and response regulator CckA